MDYVTLPDTGLQLSRVGLGGGPVGTRLTGAALDRHLAAFVEAGGNWLDTAHCYAFWSPGMVGVSEREATNSLRRLGLRDAVLIATKGGHPEAPGYPRPDRYLSPERLRRDIDDSLRRMGRERIDLYFLHRDDPRESVASIIDVLAEEVERGRLRALGASNWTAERIDQANEYARRKGVPGFAISQLHWSLAVPDWNPAAPDPAMRHVTPDIAAWHRERGLPLVGYSVAAMGYFAHVETEPAYRTERNRQSRARVLELCEQLGLTPCQLAICYQLSLSSAAIALIGTTRLQRLTAQMAAADITLTPAQLAFLDPW